MGVAVHPGDHAGLAEQEFAQLTGQDPAVCAWRRRSFTSVSIG